MPQKKHKPEEIVAKLRQVDVLLSQGRPVAEAIRAISVTAFTYYRWRKEFGGLKSDQVKRLKDLEKENERLRKAVSDLTLEKLILREAASGRRSTSSMSSRTSSSCAACPGMFVRTTVPSSSPRRCGSGSWQSARKRRLSSLAVLGKTATARASTPSFVTSF